jgi:UDP-N-acetyl-D-galactosamine dehydrogenase
MIQAGFPVKDAKINVLGLTFKENCPDLRNSRVIDVINELRSYGADVCVHDPVADSREAVHEYGVELLTWQDLPRAHAIVLAVAHRAFSERPVAEFADKLESGGLFIDVKSQADAEALRERGFGVWRL